MSYGEHHVLSVNRVQEALAGIGYNWMMLVAFAAACGTDYTQKTDLSAWVNQSVVLKSLPKAAAQMRLVEPPDARGFANYATRLITGLHHIAFKTDDVAKKLETLYREGMKKPTPFAAMPLDRYNTVVGALEFLGRYMSSMCPGGAHRG